MTAPRTDEDVGHSFPILVIGFLVESLRPVELAGDTSSLPIAISAETLGDSETRRAISLSFFLRYSSGDLRNLSRGARRSDDT